MASDGNEWELSKENVQPLRQGRIMTTLQGVLAQQDVSTHTVIQQQKRAFESEIRFYCGDDPLDIWDRYIKWTEQTFPQGGKEGNLSAVLERAIQALNEQQRYYQDPRYLSLWLKFGNCCSEPLDLYSYLHSQAIGTSLAQLYITWAEELEARENYKKADVIFQEGILHKAEPLDKLLSHHREFQARVSRQVLEELGNDCDVEEQLDSTVSEPQRTTLAELKGRGKRIIKAPISRVGNAVRVPSQGQSFQYPPSQQASVRPTFSVFDENKVADSTPDFPVLTPQPWVAPPPTKSKENELKAGPWTTGRRPRSNTDSSVVASAATPSFTPYVEETAQQQAMTPHKIESSINSVLSARKPGKEEDPLHRVQSHHQDGQEKKEQPMYCKERVYAGVEEFSFEEIRVEIYRKKRREELEALAQKKAELQRKIEEMEKVVREQQENKQKSGTQQQVEQEAAAVFSAASKDLKFSPTEQQHVLDTEAVEGFLPECFSIKSNFDLAESNQCKNSNSNEAEICPVATSMPFSIFDESSAIENKTPSFSLGLSLANGSHPLAARKLSESVTAKENVPPANLDKLQGIETLSEDAIVTGLYQNKTLFPNPEDTCDFVRAAHLVSTPFHEITEQRNHLGDKLEQECLESKTTLLNQQTVVCEGQYEESIYVKKLSPILEASVEDTRSSASSSSPIQISTVKLEQIPEKLELIDTTDEITNDVENASDDSSEGLQNAEQRKQLLQPLPDFLTEAFGFEQEDQIMPWIELEKEVNLGNAIYHVTHEYLISEQDKIFSAVSANVTDKDSAFLIKVHSEPVPWDFYILLVLQERLGAEFDQNFSLCTCFLYHNGCVTLHEIVRSLTVQDMIQHDKVIPREVILLIVYNLLEVVEKLHKAEIIHGNLNPETLFLGDSMYNSFAMENTNKILKIVDFSHSLDLQRQPTENSLKSFPITQTQIGQQIFNENTLVHQVDMLGIGNIAHLILFGEYLQVHWEEDRWKTNRDLSQSTDGDLWNTFFDKILNANGKSTVLLLHDLREELSFELSFDSSFPKHLCDFIQSWKPFLILET
ncbi:mitotic checkpoint serine/threonine-protein kinase BUB1 beta [Thamnophis elegans]|uniref:mitotic checkpoint serine/threonine-protein kinase BUB1 beta n=1 Tax=Thamnophis elegans TaxID=35005 RepID=UPI001377C2C0|nr:mitotic checkpoint serine/threonine-protein kinase BUB1 beta [Thamnophis elegans]